MNYYDSYLEAQALKLWCYILPTFLDVATISTPIFMLLTLFKQQLT